MREASFLYILKIFHNKEVIGNFVEYAVPDADVVYSDAFFKYSSEFFAGKACSGDGEKRMPFCH